MSHRFARNLCDVGSSAGLVLALWGYWQGFVLAIAAEATGLAVDHWLPRLPLARLTR